METGILHKSPSPPSGIFHRNNLIISTFSAPLPPPLPHCPPPPRRGLAHRAFEELRIAIASAPASSHGGRALQRLGFPVPNILLVRPSSLLIFPRFFLPIFPWFSCRFGAADWNRGVSASLWRRRRRRWTGRWNVACATRRCRCRRRSPRRTTATGAPCRRGSARSTCSSSPATASLRASRWRLHPCYI